MTSTQNTSDYTALLATLQAEPKTWLITGVAGFIGSNLLETLLGLNQRVVGLDNFATGMRRNLDEVQASVTAAQWANFVMIEGDIREPADCETAMSWQPGAATLAAGGTPSVLPARAVDYVLHQAALGSVPRSLADPATTNATNISGFLNMLIAARDARVTSFTYAASRSTYGDHPALPKVEDRIGKPLSPYAVTKYVNELYADVFARCYNFHTIGLRYFNVFGKRQNPAGAYAAVIPKWTASLLQKEPVYINGDGTTSRDFCFVANAVQANLLAATASRRVGPDAVNQVYNVAAGDRTSLDTLFALIRDGLVHHGISVETLPIYREFRAGDVRHSHADIDKGRRLLGYAPTHTLASGLQLALPWYVALALEASTP